MTNKLNSIAVFLVAALVLSFLAPLSAGLIYILKVERGMLEAELERFHDNILTGLENSTENSLLHFEPNEAQAAARLVILDPRVYRVIIYSNVYEMTLANLSKVEVRSDAELRVKRNSIVKGNELVGYIEVAIDRTFYEEMLRHDQKNIVVLFAAMLFCGLLLIIPAIYFKVLRPVNRLMQQAGAISDGHLQTPFKWKGQDELSRLGNTFEKMRQTLQSSFERIQKLAIKDDLTGMPNRRAFYVDAEKTLDLSNRYNHPLVMVLADIDYFKKVNDTHGHDVGDTVLQEFAALIMNTTRKTDICARIGGEEFVICMPETSLDVARNVVEKLRAIVENHPFPHNMNLTASFGLAPKRPDYTLEMLIKEADQAMYQAKKTGRNRICDLEIQCL